MFFMGAYVFNNQLFDSWLNKKSDDILSKVDRETITTEEMIILVLKAQTNHFHHMDVDMKKGLSDLDVRIDKLELRMDRLETSMFKGFNDIYSKFNHIDNRFQDLDKKIDNRFMWMIGITIALSGGIYLKLFLG